MSDGTVRYRVEFAGWDADDSFELAVVRELVALDEFGTVFRAILKQAGAKVLDFDRRYPEAALEILTGRRVKRILRNDGSGWQEYRWPLPEPFRFTSETEIPAHTHQMRAWP